MRQYIIAKEAKEPSHSEKSAVVNLFPVKSGKFLERLGGFFFRLMNEKVRFFFAFVPNKTPNLLQILQNTPYPQWRAFWTLGSDWPSPANAPHLVPNYVESCTCRQILLASNFSVSTEGLVYSRTNSIKMLDGASTFLSTTDRKKRISELKSSLEITLLLKW